MDEVNSTNATQSEPEKWTSIRISAGTRRRLDSFRADLMRYGTKNLPEPVSSALPESVTSFTPDLLIQILLGAGEHLLVTSATGHSKRVEESIQKAKGKQRR